METFLIDSKKEYLKVHFQLLSVESLTFSCEKEWNSVCLCSDVCAHLCCGLIGQTLEHKVLVT